jgi:hypothetical protein
VQHVAAFFILHRYELAITPTVEKRKISSNNMETAFFISETMPKLAYFNMIRRD